ncbi:MAG TPA: GDSL-type esterase/lipase family protein [Planctomycetota bacterium]
MRPARLLIGSGLALLGLALGLGTGELLVRALDVGPRFQVVHRELFQLADDPELGYELRPLAPDGAGRINSAGFRDREFPRARPTGVVRIVAVGDSVTFGEPRKPAESWPKALERELAARGEALGPAPIEVLNLGVTGYNAVQVARRLERLGLAHEPDLVLYGYVLNDPQELSIEREALRDLLAAAERDLEGELARGAFGLLAHSRLAAWARTLVHPAQALQPGTVEFRHRRDPAYLAFQEGDRRGAYFRALHADPAALARLRAGLDRLAAAARAAGVPAVVVLFPLLLDPREGPYPLADVHARVAAEARARGLDTLDLTDALRACGRCASDFLHPNAAGARAAATAIADAIAARGWLAAARR